MWIAVDNLAAETDKDKNNCWLQISKLVSMFVFLQNLITDLYCQNVNKL